MLEPKKLEKVTLRSGKFFNQAGKAVKAKVLGLDLASAANMAGCTKDIFPKPVFQGHEIPKGTNAFAQGSMFDENQGAWSNFPRYVAPTLYLRVAR